MSQSDQKNHYAEPAVTDAKVFLARVKAHKITGDENPLVKVKCGCCDKVLEKAGLTLFYFYTKSRKDLKGSTLMAETQVWSCAHKDYDGEPGCSCCCTIRDNKIICCDCAGWDLLSGSVQPCMLNHTYMWHDGTESYAGSPKEPKKTNKRKYTQAQAAALDAENKKLKADLKAHEKFMEKRTELLSKIGEIYGTSSADIAQALSDLIALSR
tara:strand:+ start:434 stop:1066 length:633 start_codon:yes stop_codon:yes gene_type:complete